MEEELNYLSKKIEGLESSISSYSENLSDPNDEVSLYRELIKNSKIEKQLLENILNAFTINANLVEVENVHLEDSDDVSNEGGIYYVDGRAEKAWITKKVFDSIKHVNN